MREADELAPLASATAPGKIILLGEHAVVYGQPALAVPIQAVEARATVWASQSPLTIRAHFPLRDGGGERTVVVPAEPDEALAVAVRAALARLGRADLPAWTIELASTVPIGRGMGSSAAAAVVIARAIARALGQPLSERDVSAVALAAETVTHGKPSGIDNTVIALGRPIRFLRGEATPLVISQPMTLLVADSGADGPTRQMVAGVRARRQQQPAVYDDWFERIGRLVDDAATALAGTDLQRLGRLMNTNHLVLQAMRVSTPRLDQLVGAARMAGALGAKLSGAGGGGVVVALVTPDSATAVSQALTTAGASQVLRTVVEATA
jgi:mevalonate kinase